MARSESLKRLGHTLAAHGQVAPHLAALWNTRQAKRHGLATDHQHAFVAFADGGQKLLHHHGLGAILVQRFDDAAQVQPVFLDAEDAHATHAVQRLEDDVRCSA
jgi:hypothetical protein